MKKAKQALSTSKQKKSKLPQPSKKVTEQVDLNRQDSQRNRQELVEIDGQKYKIQLLSKEQLPLELPILQNFQPAQDGLSPLYRSDWLWVKDAQGKIIGRHEADTMPNWAGSSWYYLRFIDPKNSQEFASQDKLKYWLPVDHYFGGSEHTTLHLLYSRFWHRFLYEQKLVPTKEPYEKRSNGGILLAEDGTKMSKSKGNVIAPKEKIAKYGADALRLYMNFIGPYEATTAWRESGLKACSKLLQTIWALRTKVKKTNQKN